MTVRRLIVLSLLFAQLVYSVPKISFNGGELPTIRYENKTYSIQEILSKYLQINSPSGSEKEAGEFLKQLCFENGLFITQMGDRDGNYNFTASILPLSEGKPNIIFLNHLDIVHEGDPSLWEYPAFSGTITDTEIWGRGAFDNKGNAIMQLFSIIEISKRFKDKSLNYNVSMLAVSCEETQCQGGIKFVVENHLSDLNPCVIIGEGPPAIKGLVENKPDLALFGISVAQKRVLWLQLDLEIKTNGHSSVTPLEYANKEMVLALNKLLSRKSEIIFKEVNINLLKQLGKLNGGFKGYVLKHPKFFKKEISKKLREDPLLLALFSNTVTLTSIKDKNEKVNAIPTKVTAILDCRLLPDESTENFIASLKETLENDAIRVQIINEMTNSKISSTATSFYKHLEAAILKNNPKSKTASVLLPNSNDIGIFRELGIPAYSVVPVKLERKYLESIHNFNERIPKSILTEGTQTFIDFMELCLKDISPLHSKTWPVAK